jgi:hypothetical protein
VVENEIVASRVVLEERGHVVDLSVAADPARLAGVAWQVSANLLRWFEPSYYSRLATSPAVKM